MSLPPLTTVDAVKTYAGIAVTATDDAIAALIDGASGFVRAWLNRDITSHDYDIRRNGRGTAMMLLPAYPITAVSLLEIDGQTISASQGWGQSGYLVDDTRIVLFDHCFTRGWSNIHIRFTAGYATVPAEIAQACNELVVLKYRTRDKLEVASKTLAGETVSFTQKDMPASVATLLKNYRMVAPL
jgi:hypothetical protein